MNRLRELREQAGLRQIDVANATGIDQKTLSNYETGKTYPHSYALICLADYFHVSIDYLVGRVGAVCDGQPPRDRRTHRCPPPRVGRHQKTAVKQ